MSQWKCKTCLGTYADTQADGSIYFHACGPQPPNGLGVQVPMVNPRDESITLDSRNRAIGIKAAGAGVVAVGVTALTQPAWLTTVQTAAAALP